MIEISQTLVVGIGSGLVSALGAVLVAHFIAGRDVSYMKGQLASLMDIHKRQGVTEGKIAVLEDKHKNLRDDVNKLGAKVRSSSGPIPIKGG